MLNTYKVPPCFYRISAKALILNEQKDSFLIARQEEMSVPAKSIAQTPSYFYTIPSTKHPELWVANIVYETTLEHFDFTPSEECVEIGWINQENATAFNLFKGVKILLEDFDPVRH